MSWHAVTHNEVIISHSWVAFLNLTYKIGDRTNSSSQQNGINKNVEDTKTMKKPPAQKGFEPRFPCKR